MTSFLTAAGVADAVLPVVPAADNHSSFPFTLAAQRTTAASGGRVGGVPVVRIGNGSNTLQPVHTNQSHSRVATSTTSPLAAASAADSAASSFDDISHRQPSSKAPPSITHHDALPASSVVLTFTDIPSDLAFLDFDPLRHCDSDPARNNTPSPSSTATPPTAAKSPSLSALHPPSQAPCKAAPSRTPSHSPPPLSFRNLPAGSEAADRDTTPSTTPIHSQPRKPSPGLAARLKALGFITTPNKESSSPASQQPERVGRLPQDHLRQLDQNHQAGSTVPIIERRGRPWRGAGAVVARLPSSVAALASGRSSNSNSNSDSDSKQGTEADVDVDNGLDTSSVPLLPEIETTPLLDMDTNKYRLPDHTNGNGTKVQRDTRQQHLERDSITLSAKPLVDYQPADLPPPPLPKDSPPLPPPVPPPAPNPSLTPTAVPSTPSQTDFNPDAASYFNSLGLQRPGSIYTLSRVSFTNQLAQLTSLQLPDAESLSSKVSAIPTAQAAWRALIGAAEQIRNWIAKASEVIDGLDSDDDVEWAAAGGREGLEEVENAILRFEELINVYVGAIEELQNRPDISSVSPEDLQRAVVQMEGIMNEWRAMRNTLQSVKAQVEIAMEWEELWSMVLGDIQNEMDELSRLVFEMEERRHKSIMAAGAGADAAGVDIGDLETIVEESQQEPQQVNSAPSRLPASSGNHRYSVPIFPASPSSPDPGSNSPSISQDDSSLLALFARMQPLRASLDFLPMRLSVFETRASSCFPTACDELEMRRSGLDATYKKLEKDAESLRKELGEDRWITVFRGAARQAQKMYESVERSVSKLREGVDAGMHLTNQPLMAKKIESYETKKTHYGPAIERVLAIIDRGVKDRLTLNGEIIRLHGELQAQWEVLRDRMHELDLSVEELQADEKRSQQLRDSISSMLSNDRSTLGSGHDTPQSSPPSSVIMSSLGLESSKDKRAAAAAVAAATSATSAAADKAVSRNAQTATVTTPTNKRRSVLGSHLPQPSARRSFSGSSTPGSQTQTRKAIGRFSTSVGAGNGGALSSPSREGSVTPVDNRSVPAQRPGSTLDLRPRWNSSTVGVDTGHNFKPLTLTTPSPYAKSSTAARRAVSTAGNTPGSASSPLSKLPTRSPLVHSASSPPALDGTPTRPSPAAPYRPRLLSHSSAAAASNRRASFQPQTNRPGEAAATAPPRPASSLATSRRMSMLPGARPKLGASVSGSTAGSASGSVSGSVSGRESPQAVAGARFALRKKAAEQNQNNRPKWRV